MKRIYIAAVLAVFLSGCSAVGSILEKANGGLAGLAITQATARYIEREKTPEDRAARAQRVKAVAAEVRSVASGEIVTVDGLVALVQSKLPADMEISDRLLAGELINVVAEVLKDKIGGDVIDPADLPNLDALLRRIEFAASYYDV